MVRETTQALQRQVEEFESKNSDLIRENIKLKDDSYRALDEKRKVVEEVNYNCHLVKHIQQSLTSAIKRIEPSFESPVQKDLKFTDNIVWCKELITELDKSVVSLLLNQQQTQKEQKLLESRAGGFKGLNQILQQRVEKSQEVEKEQQGKIQSMESIIKELRADL